MPLAAILPSAKAALEITQVPSYTPGPNELLVKNLALSLNPVDAKIAKLAIFPLEYPLIIGFAFAGTVEAVGAELSKSSSSPFRIGDRVVSLKGPLPKGDQYGTFQQFVVVSVPDQLVAKIPEGVDLAVAASVMMNLSCVVGMFSGRLGLDKPIVGDMKAREETEAKKKSKILIYGGSTGFGSRATEYLSQAGYSIVTTSSLGNRAFVDGLGADMVVNHSDRNPDELINELVALGPFKVVVDMISLPPTIKIASQVVARQGGGKLYAMMPPFDPNEKLPEGLVRHYEPWSGPLYEAENAELKEWMLKEYIPLGLASGEIKSMPVEQVSGGLNGLNEALGRVMQGVSGRRLVVDPWV